MAGSWLPEGTQTEDTAGRAHSALTAQERLGPHLNHAAERIFLSRETSTKMNPLNWQSLSHLQPCWERRVLLPAPPQPPALHTGERGAGSSEALTVQLPAHRF